ncbi:MAG: CpaF family protein, partial [Caulobacteraceae bacterium]
MFGKRVNESAAAPPPPSSPAAPIATRPEPAQRREEAKRPAGRDHEPEAIQARRPAAIEAPPVPEEPAEENEFYHATKSSIFNALLNAIDLSQLAQLDSKAAATEIRDIVAELVKIKNVSMSVMEQDHLVQDIINDVLGYGPLEPLLARDEIADIMVNGAGRVFIEVG